MWHAYKNDPCDITELLTPPLPLVTICHKSGDPLPWLGCDVIYGRPLGAKMKAELEAMQNKRHGWTGFTITVNGGLSMLPVVLCISKPKGMP